MISARSVASVLHSLTPAEVEGVVMQAADGLMLIDAAARVSAIHALGPLAEAICPHWTGQPLEAIVCTASRAKLPSILATDDLSRAERARWRHVNLNRRDAEPLPVLVKHLAVAEGPILVLRDLRPTVDLQGRFQRAMLELEQSYQRLGWAGSIAERADGDESEVARSVVEDMLSGVGRRPMQQIVSETVQVLERLCIRQALRQSPEDVDAAARILGLTRAELDRRSRSN